MAPAHISAQERLIVGPYRQEQRLEFISKGILDIMQPALGRRSVDPDLILKTSAMWDNVRWLREDMHDQIDIAEIISA